MVVFLKPASKACFASSMNFAYFSGFFFAAFFAKIKSLILVAMVVALKQAVEYPEYYHIFIINGYSNVYDSIKRP